MTEEQKRMISQTNMKCWIFCHRSNVMDKNGNYEYFDFLLITKLSKLKKMLLNPIFQATEYDLLEFSIPQYYLINCEPFDNGVPYCENALPILRKFVTDTDRELYISEMERLRKTGLIYKGLNYTLPINDIRFQRL